MVSVLEESMETKAAKTRGKLRHEGDGHGLRLPHNKVPEKIAVPTLANQRGL